MRLVAAQASIETGRLDAAETILLRLELPDLREGEISLSALWFDIQERRIARRESIPIDDALKQRVRRKCRLPRALDFRMH